MEELIIGGILVWQGWLTWMVLRVANRVYPVEKAPAPSPVKRTTPSPYDASIPRNKPRPDLATAVAPKNKPRGGK